MVGRRELRILLKIVCQTNCAYVNWSWERDITFVIGSSAELGGYLSVIPPFPSDHERIGSWMVCRVTLGFGTVCSRAVGNVSYPSTSAGKELMTQ